MTNLLLKFSISLSSLFIPLSFSHTHTLSLLCLHNAHKNFSFCPLLSLSDSFSLLGFRCVCVNVRRRLKEHHWCVCVCECVVSPVFLQVKQGCEIVHYPKCLTARINLHKSVWSIGARGLEDIKFIHVSPYIRIMGNVYN